MNDFRERLSPGRSNVAICVGAGALVAALVAGLHPPSALVAGPVSALALIVILWSTAPVIEVRAGVLYSGGAHISVTHLGTVETLDAAGWRDRLGPSADARAYVCHRPWVRTGVRVDVTDERDPAPYWLIASRRPGELAAAISAAAQAAHSEHTSWPPSS